MSEPLSLDQLNRLLAIKKQIAVLEAEMVAILAEEKIPPHLGPVKPLARLRPNGDRNWKSRRATRAAIAASQRAWWAKYHADVANGEVPKYRSRKRSAETRARMSAAQKARFAKWKNEKGE